MAVSGKSQSSAHISKFTFLFCDTHYPVNIVHQGKSLVTYPLYILLERKGKGQPVVVDKDERAVVDDDGILYKMTWKRETKSTTPHQRSQKKYRPDEIEYHRYTEGLISYERSLAASLLYAEGASALLEESYLIAEVLNIELHEDGVTGKNLKSLAVLSTLEGLEEVVRRRSNPSLGEAREQVRELLLWVRDGKGKPKLVIFRARWKAMVARFGERIKTVQSWNDDYLERLERVVAVKDRFYDMVHKLRSRLVDLENKTNEHWNPATAQEIRTYCEHFLQEFSHWDRLRPFNRWTARLSMDVRKLEAAVQSGSRKLVISHIDKMIRSIEIKFLHRLIDETVQLMSEAAPSVRMKNVNLLKEAGPANLEEIGERLVGISNRLLLADDRYFKRRVIGKLKFLWRPMARKINRSGGSWRTMQLSKPEHYIELRETLKEMSGLL